MKTITLIALVSLTSCTVSFDPATGSPTLTTNAEQAALIAEAVTQRVNEALADSTK